MPNHAGTTVHVYIMNPDEHRLALFIRARMRGVPPPAPRIAPEVIRLLRKSMNLSQTEFGKLIGGVTQQTVVRWERSGIPPKNAGYVLSYLSAPDGLEGPEETEQQMLMAARSSIKPRRAWSLATSTTEDAAIKQMLTDIRARQQITMSKSEIRELRKRMNLTQTALSEIVGTTPSTVSRWEAGISIPSGRAMREMSQLSISHPIASETV